MEQSGHLHGSLASFSILSWLVLLAGSQQASAVASSSPPKLSVSPPLSTFARGKQISLICSIPEGLGIPVIFFHVKARDGEWTVYTRQLENTLDLNTTHLETTQTFTCSYLGKAFQSSLSNEIVISINDPQATSVPPTAPPAPRLSLSPSRSNFIQGEQILLTCSFPQGRRAKKFHFYEKNTNDTWTPYKSQAENTLNLSTTNNQTFVCSYEENSAGIPAQSLQSNHVVISITDLPPAVLSLHPQQPVFIQGEQVTLRCSAPERLQVARYRFYKLQPSQDSREVPHKRAREYYAFNASRSTAGQYSCQYWMLQSGKEIQSPKSRPVSVVMAGDVPLTPRPVFSSATWTLPGSTVTKGRFTSITISTPTALQPGTTYTTNAHPEFTRHRGSMTSTYSPSQSAVAYTTSTHPKFMVTSGSTTPTPITLSSTDPPNATPSPASCDIAKQPDDDTPESEEGLSPLWLAIGFGSGGTLLLLAFLVCIYRRKYKDKRRNSSRKYWRTLNPQMSLRMSRCIADPTRNSISPQGQNWPMQLQPASRDWGLLPKAKPAVAKHGAASRKKHGNDSLRSRADHMFPDIDPAYTLLGMSCSTFFQEEDKDLSEKEHVYSEISV